MLRIREKLQAIVEQINASGTPATFNYANARQQNYDANSQPLKDTPTINVIQIESGVFSMTPATGSFKEKYPTVQLQFLKLSSHDYNSVQNDMIIDEMKELAKKFLLRYEASELFEPLKEVVFNQIYHYLDDDTAGIEITLPVIELDSQTVCLT